MQSAGNRSNMSRDMQELSQGKEQISNQIRGHKANLSNPTTNTPNPSTADTSEASKDQSRQAIESLGGDANMISNQDDPKSKHAAEVLDGSRAM
ncbi:putative conidiation protein con-6 [Zalerion maritima]|uniref:Conidiation protein con-6 n=1 Tax=Zalerion maritima TaxID=339359 RepID=A0AAD5RSA3_9PEZI|nr:putative conidiation protein con-6 [Zalerion maritima]